MLSIVCSLLEGICCHFFAMNPFPHFAADCYSSGCKSVAKSGRKGPIQFSDESLHQGNGLRDIRPSKC